MEVTDGQILIVGSDDTPFTNRSGGTVSLGEYEHLVSNNTWVGFGYGDVLIPASSDFTFSFIFDKVNVHTSSRIYAKLSDNQNRSSFNSNSLVSATFFANSHSASIQNDEVFEWVFSGNDYEVKKGGVVYASGSYVRTQDLYLNIDLYYNNTLKDMKLKIT